MGRSIYSISNQHRSILIQIIRFDSEKKKSLLRKRSKRKSCFLVWNFVTVFFFITVLFAIFPTVNGQFLLSRSMHPNKNRNTGAYFRTFQSCSQSKVWSFFFFIKELKQKILSHFNFSLDRRCMNPMYVHSKFDFIFITSC